jgi:hypothetical protein
MPSGEARGLPLEASTELAIFDCGGVMVDSDRLSLEIQARDERT